MLQKKLDSACLKVSENDPMYYVNGADWYFKNARETIIFIQKIIDLTGQNISEFNALLDYGSGFGRLTRYFVTLFDDVTVCDINKRAVDFTVETFYVKGYHVQEPYDSISFVNKMDLIFAGSLFTHTPLEAWGQVLRLFEKSLSDKGLVIMTAAGEYVAKDLESGGRRFGINESGVKRILADYKENGFGFSNYPDKSGNVNKSAGRCVASPIWVMNYIKDNTHLSVNLFFKQGWSGRQDIYILSLS